jgi:hypothetical protein
VGVPPTVAGPAMTGRETLRAVPEPPPESAVPADVVGSDPLPLEVPDAGRVPDPVGLAVARARLEAEQATLEAVAVWLEQTVPRVQLYRRVALAADLRDGKWRTARPLAGLRTGELALAKARELLRRGVRARDWPAGLADAVTAEQQRAEAAQKARDAADARFEDRLRALYPPGTL